MHGLRIFLSALVALLVAGCGSTPVKPSDRHLRAEPPKSEGQIPPTVQVAPPLPKPVASARPETYSVVVSNVRVDDLLFALARDAKINVDIHPGVTGTVTLNAIDQTLPQLLNRIARQIDMRFEMDGPNLMVMRDTPFLRSYRVDYISASRNVKMQSAASTQFSGGGASGGAGGGTGSTATIDVVSNSHLWEAIVQNVKDILQETDKIFPVAARTAAGAAGAAPAAAQQPQPAQQAAPAGQLPASGALAAPAAQLSPSYREAAAVIGNRESGILFVRATSRQHEKIQEFLDNVLANTRRQVLVEATIAEVQLNNQFQRGIDWSHVRRGVTGVSLRGTSAGTPAGIDTTAFVINAATGSQSFLSTINLLESFGDVRVLSSPKVSVLNNQTALLRVTRDIVYFTITPSTTPVSVTGGTGNIVVPPAFTTTPNVAAEGFMMSVLPQINESDTIVLNVRPTIRRRVAFATDPNPALPAGTPNLIPVFETRELDSILRMQSGQVAVLGGLMQDSVANVDDTMPGVRDIPGVGQLLGQRKDVNQKTELVIFLRATVVRDPSIDGDFREFRGLLPGEDFLRRPNPARISPSGENTRQ
ncbi:MAG: type II and III secretion system protein [Betaproteobacteria bacterium]|nr:type II and III secretion system protein [Betaproteobacteria bacterium]